MTRRICVYFFDEKYYISQEFNGDMAEQSRWHPNPSLTVNWNDIINIFNGSETLEAFIGAVRDLENAYGYEHVELEVMDELPNTEEVWLLSGGSLFLYSKYGELQTKEHSFIDDLMDGKATISDIDKYVEYWHTHDTGDTLQGFLGLTDDEMEEWGKSSDATLEKTINKARQICEAINKGEVAKAEKDLEI